MISGFKDFIMKGNVVDMAVGVIIGASFGTIVKSLVNDILMPPIGLLLGGVDFSNLYFVLKPGDMPPPYESLEIAQELGAVTINYGTFVNNIVSFLIVGFSVYMLINALKNMKKEAPPADPTTKECPHCLSTIPIAATKCAHCASDLSATKQTATV